jgi:hypothetical protein
MPLKGLRDLLRRFYIPALNCHAAAAKQNNDFLSPG